MPSSATSALSASPSVCVDGSDCDREPARDNDFPRDVDDYRSGPAHARRLHRDAGAVDREQLALDDGFGLAGAVAQVHALAVEVPVVFVAAYGTLGGTRGPLELVRSVDVVG